MKKQFVTSKLLKENREKTEKAIIESFAKTFNKIKRADDVNINEAMYDKLGNFLGGPDPNERDDYNENEVEKVVITFYRDDESMINDVHDSDIEVKIKGGGIARFGMNEVFRQLSDDEINEVIRFYMENVGEGETVLVGEQADYFVNLLGAVGATKIDNVQRPPFDAY